MSSCSELVALLWGSYYKLGLTCAANFSGRLDATWVLSGLITETELVISLWNLVSLTFNNIQWFDKTHVEIIV